MKFLLNENISPRLIAKLKSLNYEALHVNDCLLVGKPDVEIVEYAKINGLIIITHDLDYGRIISLSALDKPSVITLRLDKLNTQIVFNILRDNLKNLESYLKNGSLITIEEDKIRYRSLPTERN